MKFDTYEEYRKNVKENVNNFDIAFKPWEKWQNVKLTDINPCNTCDVYKEYEMRALYGNIAERHYAELPESCPCINKICWEGECWEKFGWYERNDERFK